MKIFSTRARGGFSLVEVVLALGLVSFVLVAVLGLFSVGLRGTQESDATIDASNLAAEMLGKRLASPTNELPALAGKAFGLPRIPALETLPSAPTWNRTPVIVGRGGYEATDADRAYRVTYDYWRDTNATFSPNSRMVKVHIFLSAPPDAPLATASTRYEVMTSYLVP